MIFAQGDIIALDFSPTQGHEQSGYRPCLVVSRNIYNEKTGFVIGEQIRTMDIKTKTPTLIEKIPDDLLRQTLAIVSSIFEGVENG